MPRASSNAVIERIPKPGGQLVRIGGIIDETFLPDELTEGGHEWMVIDLGGLQRLTSFGIRLWIEGLRQLHLDYYFINCSPAFVAQLGMVSGMAQSGTVVSFHAPYVCLDCENEFCSLLDLRDETVLIQLEHLELPEQKCPACGGAAEFDEMPELYLKYFLNAPRPEPPVLVNAVIDGRKVGRRFQIEKEIREFVTALRLSGELSDARYFKRVADGLHGHVVVIAEDIDQISDDGAAGFVRFLKSPGLKPVLARVPPLLVAALARRSADLGNSILVSVSIACRCEHCDCEVAVEVDASSFSGSSNEPSPEEIASERYCPRCGRQVTLIVGDWLEQARALPTEPPEDPVRAYLEEARHAPAEPSPAISLVGDFTSRYQIRKRIGQGGMGDVFLAQRVGPGGFKKPVVIKTISPSRLGDPGIVELFLQEARLAACLSHPNIVQIFDLGKNRGEYFLAMEYVSGPDLRTVIIACRKLQTQIPITFCCRIVSDVCSALHAAHTYNDDGTPHPIIHRDVSPGNVLISSNGTVKLTDFGIAKSSNARVTTEPGTIKGTMRYIAPESIKDGGTDALHPRIDVYGAGVLLYECLMRKPLFAGVNWANTLQAIISRPIPDLSQERPEVPPRLIDIFKRAVERDPTQRYQRIAEMYHDIEELSQTLSDGRTRQDFANWITDLIKRATEQGMLADELKSDQDTTRTTTRDSARILNPADGLGKPNG